MYFLHLVPPLHRSGKGSIIYFTSDSYCLATITSGCFWDWLGCSLFGTVKEVCTYMITTYTDRLTDRQTPTTCNVTHPLSGRCSTVRGDSPLPLPLSPCPCFLLDCGDLFPCWYGLPPLGESRWALELSVTYSILRVPQAPCGPWC